VREPGYDLAPKRLPADNGLGLARSYGRQERGFGPNRPHQALPTGPSSPGTQAVKRGKSKRDLMVEVLDMSARPGCIPAGFFMQLEGRDLDRP